MRSSFITATLVSLVPSIVALTINTPPSAVQCQPLLLQWLDDGTKPYFLSIIPGGQPNAPALRDFPNLNENKFTWNVDLQANTGVTFQLKDSTGATAFTDVVNIQSSSNSTCLNGQGPAAGPSSNTVAGNTAAAPIPTGSGTRDASSPTNTGTGSAAATSGASNTNSSSRASSSTTSGAAPARSNGATNVKISTGTFGMAGVMGLIGLAVL